MRLVFPFYIIIRRCRVQTEPKRINTFIYVNSVYIFILAGIQENYAAANGTDDSNNHE